LVPLNQAIEYFLEDSALGLASTTLRNYRYNLAEFSSFVGELQVATLQDVSAVHVRKYLVGVKDKGYSAWAVHQRYRVVGRLLRWCLEQGYLSVDVMRMVRCPAKPRPVPYSLSLVDLRKLMAAAGATNNPERDCAIVVLLLDTGLRRAELAGLLLLDLDFDARLVTVRVGKGGKGRRVPISSQCVQSLAAWRVVRPSDLGDSFFGLSGDGLHMLFLRLRAKCGVHVYCHALRHTFATLYRGDVQDLQKILGHADVSTTAEIYRFRETAALVRFHDERSPVGQFGMLGVGGAGAGSP
jgi:site-specific recombinase XerD